MIPRTIIFVFVMLFVFTTVKGQEADTVQTETTPVIEANDTIPAPQRASGDSEEPKIRRSIFRTIASKLTLNVSSGYGRTLYSHELSEFILTDTQAGGVLIFNDISQISNDSLTGAYANWFNDAVIAGPVYTTNADFRQGTDTSAVRMRGRGTSFPIMISAHFKFDRYRFGGGAAFQFHLMGTFRPRELSDTVGRFDPGLGLSVFKRYFGMVGMTAYEFWDTKVIPEVQFGILKRGGTFNQSAIQSGIYVNGGVRLERNLSEYFAAFVKPSFEYKTFTLTIPETGQSIVHRAPAWFVNVGVSLSLPELPRCPVRECHVQMNHVHPHLGKEYRSRRHPFWKWQNPNYGQNDKKLIKYRGKNKRKRNPY